MRFETYEGRTPRLVLSVKMDYEAEIGFVLVRRAEHRRRRRSASLASRSSTIFRPTPGDGVTHRHGAAPGQDGELPGP